MSSTAPASLLEIYAVAAAERPLLDQAGRVLSACLGDASPTTCAVQVVDAVRSDFLLPGAPALPAELYVRGLVPAGFHDYRGELYADKPRIVVLSLWADVVQTTYRHRRDDYPFVPLPAWRRGWTPEAEAWLGREFVEEPLLPVEQSAGNWRTIIGAVQRFAGPGVFLCNVFRHVSGGLSHRFVGGPESLRERILRFNLMLTEVSCDTGANVVDLDRALAGAGARALGTDYRLEGGQVAVTGGAALAATLLEAGLDDFIGPDLQARAAHALEARQAAASWLMARTYRDKILNILEFIGPLDGQMDAERAERLGNLLVRSVHAIRHLGTPATLTLHRRFVQGLRATGEAYLDLARALAGRRTEAIQAAVARVQAGDQQLGVFWKAFREFSKRSTTFAD